jgi:hypothetical protein
MAGRSRNMYTKEVKTLVCLVVETGSTLLVTKSNKIHEKKYIVVHESLFLLSTEYLTVREIYDKYSVSLPDWFRFEASNQVLT